MVYFLSFFLRTVEKVLWSALEASWEAQEDGILAMPWFCRGHPYHCFISWSVKGKAQFVVQGSSSSCCRQLCYGCAAGCCLTGGCAMLATSMWLLGGVIFGLAATYQIQVSDMKNDLIVSKSWFKEKKTNSPHICRLQSTAGLSRIAES